MSAYDPYFRTPVHPNDRPADVLRYWWCWAAVVLTLALVAGGATLNEVGWGPAAGVSALFGLILWCVYLLYLTPLRPGRASPAKCGGIDIPVRRHQPAALLLWLGTLSVYLIATPALLPGEPVAWGCVVVGAGLVSFWPTHLRALLRRPRLRLTPEGLDYRGWSVDAAVAWEDVVDVDTGISRRFTPQRTLTVHTSAGAGSRRWRQRRLIYLLEDKERPDTIEIPYLFLDAPVRVQQFLARISALPPDYREFLLGSAEFGELTEFDPPPDQAPRPRRPVGGSACDPRSAPR